MSYGPCLNPNCASHGAGHPNCQCYAEGGDVESGHNATEDNKETFWEDDAQPIASPQPEPQGFWGPEAQEVPEPKKESFWGSDAEPVTEQYQTAGQKGLTALEGAAQGFAGPVATAAELGISKLGKMLPSSGIQGTTAEDIAGRQQANPEIAIPSQIAGLGAGLLTGTGEAGLASQVASRMAPEALGQIGQRIVANGIASGMIQGGDEISKALLGQGDESHPLAVALANTGAAGLLGLGGGAVAEALGPVAQRVADKISKPGEQLLSFLNGVASEARGLPSEFEDAAFKQGQKAYSKYFVPSTAAAIGAYHGYESGDGFMDSAKKAVEGSLKYYVGGKALQYALPMLLKAAENPQVYLTAEKVDGIIDYAKQLAQGQQKISNGIGNLFKAGTTPVINSARSAEEKYKKRLSDYIENGGFHQNIDAMQSSPEVPAFAEGGEVQKSKPKDLKGHGPGADDAIAGLYPSKAINMNAAKMRVSSYLNSVRPQPALSSLPFDKAPDDRQQAKSYDRALGIAVNPLKILDKIKSGRVMPEDIKHFKSMYPELDDHLQKEITKQIVDAQVKGKKPDYHVRQGMSLLMGTNLSSELSQPNIQAAQAIYQPIPKPPEQGQATKKKRSTAPLSKASGQYLTASQARQMGQQKPD